jgi:hypothetical protein
MFQDNTAGWKIVEVYCRNLMAAPQPRLFRCRPCCGKKDPKYKNEKAVQLVGCTKIQLALDIFRAATDDDPMTLFHSINPNHKLFDFIYKDNSGTFHAFQATLDEQHDAKQDSIRALREMPGNPPFVLSYLIPQEQFGGFVTKPTNPEIGELSSAWHILIPNPNREQNSSKPASQL